MSAFTSKTWEKKPILIQRKNPDFYKGLFSTSEFDRILREVIHPLLMPNPTTCAILLYDVMVEHKACVG